VGGGGGVRATGGLAPAGGARAGRERADFSPAYDDDGGLLLVLTPQ